MSIEDIDLRDIYEFMETGNPKNAPAHVVAYLELLDKVRGMFNRIDQFGSKDIIIKHLMISDKLSRYKAAQVCDECIEYFNHSRTISKDAWRNFYADKADKMINFSMLTVKDVNDAQKVVKMLMDIANLRGVNEPDKEELPEDIFRAPFVVYSCDAEFLGMPKIDRKAISEFIDKLPELSEKEREHIRRESGVSKLKLFPNEQEDARKS